MLSRMAESLFWIGRYNERADDTARILDVYLHLLLEDTWVDESSACRALFAVMGADPPEQEVLHRRDVLRQLGTNRDEAASIAGSLVAARENGRRARGMISAEMWEVLNTTKANIPTRVSNRDAHRFFSWVRERCALAIGIAASTISRDSAWAFLDLGRSLERADMTARLLAARALIPQSVPSWTITLQSIGAYEAYLRTYGGTTTPKQAAEFLIVDRLFPRSILYNIQAAQRALNAIQPSERRIEYTDNAQLLLARLRAELELRALDDILDDLPQVMEEVQSTITEVYLAIRERFFLVDNVPTWVGGEQ